MAAGHKEWIWMPVGGDFLPPGITSLIITILAVVLNSFITWSLTMGTIAAIVVLMQTLDGPTNISAGWNALMESPSAPRISKSPENSSLYPPDILDISIQSVLFILIIC